MAGNNTKLPRLLFLATLIILLFSCDNESLIDPVKNPDYSDSFFWASLPSSTLKNVDVFYVYPTLFGGTENKNMNISDEIMRKRVQAVIPKQAGIFTDHCNIYVPYYRQMSLDGLKMNATDRNKHFVLGLNDIERAFDFYLDKLNNNRPFILAGHSQGSEVLIQLMKTKFGDSERMNKLVAAYLIGYSVTSEDLAQCEWLKIAESANDIGVIVTYNTQSESATGSPVLLPNANCINPLNWKTTSEYASKEENLGAVFFKNNGEIDSIVNHFTDAWIDKNGALVAGSPDINTYSSPNFPEGVYHKFDYTFFFNNLKENVATRINSYFNP